MKLLDRLGGFEAAVALGERLLRWGPALLGAGGAAWLTGWAAQATAILGAYTPLAWVLGGFGGALLFLSCLFLWSAARVRLARYRLTQDLATRLPHINPLETNYTRQRIDIAAFKTPFPEPVANKTFIGCELRGPAVVAFLGRTTIMDAGFMECEFIKVRDDAQIFNVIPLHNTTIQGGKLYYLTILVPESLVGVIPKGAKWLT